MAWSRSDIISTVALGVAIVAVVPTVIDGIAYFNRTRGQITTPSEGQHVNGRGLAVEGRLWNVPSDSDVWLLVRTGRGSWYPIARCQPARDGRFAFQPGSVQLGDTGVFQLSLYLIGAAKAAAFQDYIQSGKGADADDPGMSSLPDGISQLDDTTVTRDS